MIHPSGLKFNHFQFTLTESNELQPAGFRHFCCLRKGIAEGYYREDLDIELSSIFHSVQISSSYENIITHIPKISKKRLTDFYIDMIVRLITNEKGLKYIEEKIK